jgi:nucleoside-diphosphate-sugar epimerase
MRVLLTGANGFVGSRVARVLKIAGIETHVLGRAAVEALPFHRHDLLDGPLGPTLERIRPTHLLHTAWHSERSTLWHGPGNLAWVAATIRLVLAFRDAGGRRAVLAGTCAEYDWSHPRLDEVETPLRPATLYGRSKAELSRLLTSEHLSPLSVGWARIFFPFGPYDKPDRLLSQVIDGVAAGRPVDCSEGRQVRPFIHVDDVAAALVALLHSDVEGAVNIALDEAMSVRELALLAAAEAGDPSLLRFGTRPLMPGDPPLMTAAIARLTREVGFAPTYTIAEGVRATVRERLCHD